MSLAFLWGVWKLSSPGRVSAFCPSAHCGSSPTRGQSETLSCKSALLGFRALSSSPGFTGAWLPEAIWRPVVPEAVGGWERIHWCLSVPSSIKAWMHSSHLTPGKCSPVIIHVLASLSHEPLWPGLLPTQLFGCIVEIWCVVSACRVDLLNWLESLRQVPVSSELSGFSGPPFSRVRDSPQIALEGGLRTSKPRPPWDRCPTSPLKKQ